MNKTPLANRTRRLIGNDGPDVYLPRLEAEAGMPGNWLDDVIFTHRIDPAYLRGLSGGRGGPLRMLRKAAPLSAEDFDAFYEMRATELLKLIRETAGISDAKTSEDDLAEDGRTA